jgi:hypothetical protein
MSQCEYPMRDGDDDVSWAVSEIVRLLTPLSAGCRQRVFAEVCQQCGIDPSTLHGEQGSEGGEG